MSFSTKMDAILEASRDMDATMEYVYNTYGMMPNSRIHKLSSVINDKGLRYVGRMGTNDVYANESALVGIPLTRQTMFRGEVNFVKMDEDEVCLHFGIKPAIEDITATVERNLRGMDVVTEDLDFDGATVGGDEGGGNAMGGAPQTPPAGGGAPEDITQTTANNLGTDAPDATDVAGDMGGDDMGNPEGGEPGGENPEMLDDDDDGEDNDDEGTAAKKRIRKNMYKLHTIIKDALDAMATFTPSYDVANSKKYYRIQNVLNTEDEILVRIITKQINDFTVEDLMKKYTTLCNIFDIATREMHEFKEEYKKLSESRGKKTSRKANDQ